jgi:DNA-binding GntR family transcriptional regulator
MPEPAGRARGQEHLAGGPGRRRTVPIKEVAGEDYLVYGMPHTRGSGRRPPREGGADRASAGVLEMSTGVQLKPLAVNFTLKDHIYDVLREAILSMNIYDEEADLRLDERKMAGQLGISRTPIREALARLEQDGFVEIRPRRGVFVRRKSLDEVLEVIVVWAALESMAARLAVEVATDAELRSLRKLGAEAGGERAGIEEYSEHNIRFHQRVLELSRCAMLKSIADGLFLHMHAVRRRAIGEEDRARRSAVDHMAIIEALESRDADKASQLVREHTMRLHEHVRRSWTRPATVSRSQVESS